MTITASDGEKDAPAKTRALTRATAIAVCVLAVFVIVGAVDPIYRLPLHLDYNYNEGWNAYFTSRAAQGLPIYRQQDGLVWANYPPVSFFLVALFDRWTTDYVVTGRLVAGAACLTVAAGLLLLAARHCRSWLIGWFTALFFLAGMMVHYRTYVGMDDPQMLGHAFMVLGLLALMRSESAFAVVVAAALIVLGGFTKHTLIGVPVAVSAYLLYFDRRRFAIWLCAVLVFAALGFALCHALFGEAFFTQVFAARTYSIKILFQKSAEWYAVWSLPLAAALLAGICFPDERLVILGLFITVASSVVAVLLAGGSGVYYSLMFDVLIGLSIASGAIIAAVQNRVREPRARLAAGWLPILLCLGLIIAAPASLARGLNHVFGNKWLALQAADGVADTDYLAAIPGPAFCEKLALCYWANKPFEIDHFNAHQAILIGRLDEAVLTDKVRQRYFQVVQLTHYNDADVALRYTDNFLRLLAQHYRLDRRSRNGVFFRPKPE